MNNEAMVKKEGDYATSTKNDTNIDASNGPNGTNEINRPEATIFSDRTYEDSVGRSNAEATVNAEADANGIRKVTNRANETSGSDDAIERRYS